MAAPLPPPHEEAQPQIAQVQTQYVETAALQARLAMLSMQLKELQHQRGSLIARMMVHVDEVNRILEQLGGLQGAENDVRREWNRVSESITTAGQTGNGK